MSWLSSVKIEDVFESGRSKNQNLNETVYRLIQMIEKNGDSVITDFRIILDENGDFAYTVEGTSLLRFLADVYGYTTIDKLKEDERTSTGTGDYGIFKPQYGQRLCHWGV